MLSVLLLAIVGLAVYVWALSGRAAVGHDASYSLAKQANEIVVYVLFGVAFIGLMAAVVWR